jgi:hypothetical protein
MMLLSQSALNVAWSFTWTDPPTLVFQGQLKEIAKKMLIKLLTKTNALPVIILKESCKKTGFGVILGIVGQLPVGLGLISIHLFVSAHLIQLLLIIVIHFQVLMTVVRFVLLVIIWKTKPLAVLIQMLKTVHQLISITIRTPATFVTI